MNIYIHNIQGEMVGGNEKEVEFCGQVLRPVGVIVCRRAKSVNCATSIKPTCASSTSGP